MAEQHPVGFQWVVEARERGCKVMHVDPRFTRTSASSDIWVPLRAGTDILFLGALINYVLQNEKWFKEYVLHYTNATTLVREDYRDSEDGAGLFSGWDAEKKQYSPETWLYAGSPPNPEGTLGAQSRGRGAREGPRRRGREHARVRERSDAQESALRVERAEAAL